MKTDRAHYLILGNSTAAVGAVEGIRSADADTPITLVSREPCHTYSRPLISYLLAGEVDEGRMHYRPRDFYERHNVDARLGVEAIRVDAAARAVETSGGKRISFEKLLIATGGRPFVPPMEGGDAHGIFTFTSWDDAKAIGAYIEERRPERALVVGGGLIGVKAAEALHARGLAVTVVELGERLLPLALDEKASALAAASAREAGVELRCGTTVARIESDDGRVRGARLKDGNEVACDLVVMAVGVVPDLRLVDGSGIGTDRGIIIDDHCRTSAEGIYAAGDVAQGRDTLTGESRPIPVFPGAYRQGHVAGINMATSSAEATEPARSLGEGRAGGEARMDAAFAMNSVEVFGLPTISVGLATAGGEGYEVLTRSDATLRSSSLRSTSDDMRTYRRIVIRDGRVVGALFVGDVDRAGIMTGLIRERVDVSGIKDLLLSDEFGLISLPAEYRKHVVQGNGIEV